MNTEQILQNVKERYPEQLNPYCRQLIADHPELAPLYLADVREWESAGLDMDGLGETTLSPFPHLIRTYRDRAVLLTTGHCFARCRFCFRKRLWRTDCDTVTEPDDNELAAIAAWLKANPEVDDILLSGGDILTLPDEKILHLIRLMQDTGTIRTIRICSRAPASCPERITDELAAMLGSVDGLWFMCHFNHPAELTPQAECACRKLIAHGVPMLNQAVLLAGINDDPEILRQLFKHLTYLRVKPHYLFHVDPVEGVAHFATGVEKGLEIMASFRDNLSSIARPDFAVDLPCGGGKVILNPTDNLQADGSFWSPIKKIFMRHPLTEKTVSNGSGD